MGKKSDIEIERGFTWRSILALIYCVIVFEAVMIYIYLMTGGLVLLAISWPAMILFAELSRLAGRPLSKQEATVIYLGAGVANNYIFAMNLLYALYYRNSGIAKSFGIAEHIPSFYAPATPEAALLRTFFHPAWIYPITVMLVTWWLMVLCDLSLAFIGRQIFIRTEKLPFPLQQPIAAAITTVAERQPMRMRILASCSIVGLIYGLLAYGIPSTVSAYGYTFQPIPVPWIDLNTQLHKLIRGASFGIATDLVMIANGLIIPFPVVIAIFITSFIVYMVINPLLVMQGISQFSQEFFEGMSISDIMQRSTLFFWANPIIGIAVGIGVMPLIRHPNIFVNSIKTLVKSKSEGGFPLWVTILPFIGGSLALTLLVHYLVPAFPIYILLLLNMGWSFIYFLTTARASGVAMPVTIPYVKELSLMASGYPGYDIWFAPIYTMPTDYTSAFKVCDLTDTNPMDFVKTVLVVAPLSLLFGFIFLNSFWQAAPIPSAFYKGVFIMWPVQASMQTVFISRCPGIFNPILILGSFILISIIYIVTDLLGLAAASVGVAVGVATAVPIATTLFIGAMLGKALEKIVGKEWLREYRAVIIAGLALGEALGILLGTAGAVILRSMYGVMMY